MRKLRKLSNRKLDQLEDILTAKYWKTADCVFSSGHLPKRFRGMLVKIAKERMRRLGIPDDNLTLKKMRKS